MFFFGLCIFNCKFNLFRIVIIDIMDYLLVICFEMLCCVIVKLVIYVIINRDIIVVIESN